MSGYDKQNHRTRWLQCNLSVGGWFELMLAVPHTEFWELGVNPKPDPCVSAEVDSGVVTNSLGHKVGPLS